MAAMGYPPFSAPATVERRKMDKSRSWLRSAKEVFMKPWKNRPSNRRQQLPRRGRPVARPALSPYQQMPGGGFSFAEFKSSVEGDRPSQSNLFGGNIPLPFSGNRLSPDGGPGAPSKESGSETEIKIPETAYGSRPPLSNIFPMTNSRKDNGSATKLVTASQNPFMKSPQPVSTSAIVTASPSATATADMTTLPPAAATHPPAAATHPPPVTSPPAIVTPPAMSTAYSRLLPHVSPISFDQRRHSTPITSSLSAPVTPRDHRRTSATSSDISADKLRNHRRERRSSATREIPLLPKRGQDPFQCSSHSSTLSSPEPSVSPYCDNGPYTPYQQQLAQIDPTDPRQVAAGAIGPSVSPQRPPVGPGGQLAHEGHAPQVWLPPHAQLKELQEELDDNDEPDGAENFLTMIDEMEEVDYHHPPQNTNPIQELKKGLIPRKNTEKPNNLGFGVKLGLRLSSKKRGPDKNNKKQGDDIPAILKQPKEPDPEVKGFDGFFLY